MSQGAEATHSRDHGAANALSSGPVEASHTLASAALLQGGKTVNILHNGCVYRLQATRLGKLILTK